MFRTRFGLILCLVGLLSATIQNCDLFKKESAEKDEPVALADFMPMGVYLPWGRIISNAEHNGVEKWTWIANSLAGMREHHINTIWVVGLTIEDFRPLIDLCESYDMKIIPDLVELTYSVPVYRNNWTYLEEQARRAIAVSGNSSSILAWCLCDEPSVDMVGEMELYRQLFQQWGAEQPTIAVTQWSVTPTYGAETEFEALCVDVYPFFYNGDLSITSLSQSYYQRSVTMAVTAALETGKTAWVMPQMFANAEGPWSYTTDYDFMALPGSVVGWRTPTSAEVRWQVWSALANGMKGFIFFLYNADSDIQPDATPYTGTDYPSDYIITDTTVIPGCGGFVRPDGQSTPQYETLSETFAALDTLKSLLLHSVPADSAIGELLVAASLGNFYNPSAKRSFAVLANNDIEQAQTILLRLKNRQTVCDLLTKKQYEPDADNIIQIPLEPGMAAVLEYTP